MRMEICAFFIVLMDSKIYANFILAKKILLKVCLVFT